MDLLLAGLALLIGFVLLTRGADALVDGGATLARHLGVSAWVIGLTVVAWGTSVPEIVVSALAAHDDRPGYALGNVIGSNIANIGLVLGATGLILPRVLSGRVGAIDAFMVVAGLGAVWFTLHDRVITRIEGGCLLAIFAFYTLSIFRRTHTVSGEMADEVARPWLSVLLGCLAIVLGARAVLHGSYTVAEHFGLTGGLVGLVLLAVGTSLPELAAGISSARRGHAEIGLGNVVGSNLFNTFGVTGIAALVRPLGATGDGDAWRRDVDLAFGVDLPVNLGATLLLLALPWLGSGRAKAFVLLAGYFVYAGSLTSRVG